MKKLTIDTRDPKAMEAIADAVHWTGVIEGKQVTIDVKKVEAHQCEFQFRTIAIHPQIVDTIIRHRDIDIDYLKQLCEDKQSVIFSQKPTYWVDHHEIGSMGVPEMTIIDGIHILLAKFICGVKSMRAFIIPIERLDEFCLDVYIIKPDGTEIRADDVDVRTLYGLYTKP